MVAARLLVALGVLTDLGALVAYKYLGFLVENLLPVLKLCGAAIPVPKIALPIGISFYVFQILSYLVDVYRREVDAQKNPFKFMLYVSLFPQLIAGPIVRYSTIAADIENRKANFENIVAGLRRFAIGLAKKVLIADTMASNVHFEPVFEQTNVVLNAGSLITVGDCYRETVSHVFQDAGVFDAKKILTAPRGTKQDPKTYRDFAGDLRLVLLCFQSFNTGRLDARRDELKAIFTALQSAVREAKSKDKEKKS